METIEHIYMRLTGRPVTTIETIYTGITNTNFLVNRSDVIRQKNLFLDPFYHFDTEKKCLDYFSRFSIGPKVIAFDKSTGTIITEYIPNTTFLHQPPTEEELELVANILNVVHQTPIQLFHHFKPLERLYAYKDIVDLPLLPQAKEQAIIAAFSTYYDLAEKVICHNDVVRGNLLFHKDQLQLIDYEYAGLNDPFFDHISFLSENDIVEWPLIEKYFECAKIPFDQEKIVVYFAFLDLLWLYWAMSLYQKTAKSIFKEIGQIKFERLQNPLKKMS